MKNKSMRRETSTYWLVYRWLLSGILVFLIGLILVIVLSINPDLSPDKLCLGNTIQDPLICDYRFTAQDTYISPEVIKFGLKTNGIVMPGNPLGSPQSILENTPGNVKTFLEMKPEAIEAEMIKWVTANKMKGTTDLVVLDIEAPKIAHASSWDDILAGEQPLLPAKDFPKLMAAVKMRIDLAKKHMPNAKLSLFGVVTPHPQGKDQNYDMTGYFEAGKLGVYDNLNGITPILYARGDNCDPEDKWFPYVEAYTQQAIAKAKLVRKSDGITKLNIYPIMSTIVANPSSKCDRKQVSAQYVYRQTAALQKIPGVKAASYWISPQDPDYPNLFIWLAKTKPVPSACFCP